MIPKPRAPPWDSHSGLCEEGKQENRGGAQSVGGSVGTALGTVSPMCPQGGPCANEV